MAHQRPPLDHIVRAMPSGYELRETGVGSTLTGHFSVFNQWTEIHSAYEGHFLERIAPGAFAKTIADKMPKVLFNHGQDPTMGDQVLGIPSLMEEDAYGARYEVPLFEGVPPLLRSGLAAGAYGSSFRFRVTRGADPVSATRDAHGNFPDYNPDGLPERTIREVELYEFGPVTFPAYAGATAGMRSMTDEYLRSILADPIAPSVVDAEPAHLDEAERREEPDPPNQPAPIADQDPPEGGSSDSRKESPVADTPFTNREDMASRAKELDEALDRQAAAYPGRLPADEQARYDADTKEVTELRADIAAWDKRQADMIERAQRAGNVEPTMPVDYAAKSLGQINRKAERDIYSLESRATSFEGRNEEYRDDAMRILDITRSWHPSADVERSKDQIANLLEVADTPDKELARRLKITGSPQYRRAFEKIVRGRGTNGLTPEEQRGTALAVGVDGTGGFAVPFAFDPTVIAIGVNNGAVNPYRKVCRVVQIVGTDTWNALTATAVTATRTTEAAPAVEQGPTFAQPQYIVKRVQGQITASYELLADRNDLASELASLIQEAKDNEEETSWATGVGTTTASLGVAPVSGTSGAYTAQATAGSGAIVAGDIDATEAALPVRHRFNAQWFMNRLTIRRIQALETTGGKLFGGSIYFPSVGQADLSTQGNTGLRLLGYPINESPSIPTATTTTIAAATLLNPQSYVIVDRVGLSIQFIPWLFNSSSLATGQAAIYFLYRNDARPLNNDGGRTLRYL